MSQGSDHVEDASYHDVCFALALGGYMAQFADFVGYEPEEASDTGTHHHVGISSTAQAPKVLATENEYEEQSLMGVSGQSALNQDWLSN